MIEQNFPHYKQPVSFVRRGSRLQGGRARAWQEHSSKYLLQVPRELTDTSVDPDFRFDAESTFGRLAPLTVEVGSGSGEAIVAAAAEHPERDYLALEVYLPGLAQTVQHAAKLQLKNLRLAQADAHSIFATTLLPASVHEVWTYFPDPWPKTKHEKRRLVTQDFVTAVSRALSPGAHWFLATDWAEYAQQILETLNASKLQNAHPSWAPRQQKRRLTSFENKGLVAGRAIRELDFFKPDSPV